MRIKFGRHRSRPRIRRERTHRRSQRSKPLGIGGKLFGSIFFGAFLAGGLFFGYLLSQDLLKDADERTWPQVHGELLESDILIEKNNDDPFLLQAQYRYTVDGEVYTGQRIKRNADRYDDYRNAQLALNKLRSQQPLRVYYNPENPGSARLVHDALWKALFLILPLVFILIGGGGIIAMWFFSSGQAEDDPDAAISSQAKPKAEKAGWVFLIFALAGGLFMSFFIKPMVLSLSAGDWPEVPCRVIFSELRSYDSDDGTTYKADILYEYEFEGQRYRSNKYEFMGGSSSGRSGKVEILRKYSENSTHTCFVNPKDPTLAVLHRGFSWVYLFALIPLIFVFIGVGGFLNWIWNRHAPERPTTQTAQQLRNAQAVTQDGEIQLKSKQHRIGQLIILIIAALFWNGIVFGFLVREVVQGWQKDNPDIILTLFAIPFALVGIVIAFACVGQFLKLFNPVLELYINPPHLTPGGSADVRWRMKGGLKSVEEFTLKVKAEEITKYRRGTTTYTDKHTIYEDILVEGERFQEVDRGSATLTLPPNVMHSFDRVNNKIVWTLTAHGSIHFWPDVNIAYEIPVHAAERTS